MKILYWVTCKYVTFWLTFCNISALFLRFLLISNNSLGCLFRYVSQSNQVIAIQFTIVAKTNAYFYKNEAILILIRE